MSVNDIDRAKHQLEIAECQYNYADADHRRSATWRLNAAIEDYNTAIAMAKADAGLAPVVPSSVSAGGVRFYAALSESRSLFCPSGLEEVANRG